MSLDLGGEVFCGECGTEKFLGQKISAMRPFWAKKGQKRSKMGQKWPKMAKNGKNHSFLGPFWPKTSQIRAYRRFFDPSAQARV